MKCAIRCLGKKKNRQPLHLKKKILWPLYILLGLTRLYIAGFYYKEPGYLGGMGEMILPPTSLNVCNNELHIIGVTCTFNGKGIIKRHPASQHTSHFLGSLAKETLIYPQIIPQPDHKLLAAPYLVTPPAMQALAHITIL